jgi:thymidylate synthase
VAQVASDQQEHNMKYDSIHEAYLTSLADVYDNPDSFSSPRGQRVREKLNYSFTVLNPKPDPIITFDVERNKVIKDYSQKEFDLYESCDNTAEAFGKASKFWLKLANPDGTVNSAYGYLIFKNKSHGSDFEQEQVMVSPPQFPGDGSLHRMVPVRRTPWEWAKMSLIQDKDTRQAIIRFSLPEHQWNGNKDQTCTLHGIFMIRDNKLNLTINMRSNDLTLGLVYDLPWFISLIYKMKEDLKDVYPDLEIGSYTHYVHNLHIYERDEERILKMLGRLD